MPIILRKGKVEIGNTFGKTIYYSGPADASITDLQQALKDATGQDFQLVPNATADSGIHIIATPLDDKDGQQFDLEVNGLTKATIWYSEYTGINNSLRNGIYRFLKMLGIEWLSSNDNGFNFPKTLPKLNIPRTTFKPDFINRQYFGTGGNGPVIPGGNIEFYKGKRYGEYREQWSRRNTWGADNVTQGHSGDSFYYAKQSILEAHPEWFVNHAGMTQGRIKIEYPEAVQTYIDWEMQLYNNAKANGQTFISLPCDPADGRGGSDDPLPPFDPGQNYATMPDGIKIYNHADKWHWVALQVDKQIPLSDVHTVCSIMAYGDGPTNALAPNFELGPHTYPNLNPWAFQTAYIPRASMLAAWEPKLVLGASVYDYINITQWSVGLPQHAGIFNAITSKIDLYTQNKIDGTIYESTDVNMLSHIFYILNEKHWDASQDVNTLYNDWLIKMFGPAAAPDMKKMFDRWANNYQQSADTAFSLINIRDAANKVEKNGLYWRRIMDYAAYIHFCIMMYETTNYTRQEVFLYMYKINHLQMVQTPAFIGEGYLGVPPPSGEGIVPLTYNEIEFQFQQDLANHPVQYTVSNFVFDPAKATKIDSSVSKADYGLMGTYYIFPKGTSFTARVYTGPQDNEITIMSDDAVSMKFIIGPGDYTITKDYGADGILYGKQVTVPCIPNKRYSISCRYLYQLTSVEIEAPDMIYMYPVGDDLSNYGSPYMYFYCPTDIDSIVFFDATEEGVNGRGYICRYSDNSIVNYRTTISQHVYKVLIPPADRGTLLYLNWGHSGKSLINIPNITSLSPFIYTP